MIQQIDGEFDTEYLVGNKADIMYLAGLFGLKESDMGGIKKTNALPAGKVYLVTKDFMDAELAVSEKPGIDPWEEAV